MKSYSAYNATTGEIVTCSSRAALKRHTRAISRVEKDTKWIYRKCIIEYLVR